ncbi:MAG: hypothetical protein ACTSR3_13805 [Candidatus Helarchaeota archaeon]
MIITKISNIKRLDQIWRAIIDNLPIIENINEFFIIKYLVQNQNKFPMISKYPYVFGFNFPLDPKFKDIEKIDLIFTDGEKNFLAIKVKYFDKSLDISEKKRKKQNEELYKLASIFADKFKAKHPSYNIDPMIFTNESFEIDYKNLYMDFITYLDEQWKYVQEIYKSD